MYYNFTFSSTMILYFFSGKPFFSPLFVALPVLPHDGF